MKPVMTAICCLLLCATVSAEQTKPVAQIQRVLIVSIDGLRPDLLLRGDTPNLHNLFENGSYTFWAKTTAASTTLPSHVSMFTGVVPEAHGVTWNADLPLEKPVYPLRPTLFELAKKNGLTTAIATGKSKFEMLARPGSVDWKFIPTTSTTDDVEVITHAEQILREYRPHVMFVHLAGVDMSGHSKGWGSAEQMEAVAHADSCLGLLLVALDELELRDSTMIIVSADHGGAGRTHGPDDVRSRTIPWIVNGPGIRKGFDLTRIGDLEVETFDTFATSCHMLGIPIEHRVRGKFVSHMLESQELLVSPRNRPEPATQPAQ